MTIEEFLALPAREISELLRHERKPQTGIFVPDGNRRMTLALSHTAPDSVQFLQKNVEMTTQYFQRNLEVFFSHGLKNLIVPLISPSVLNREQRYQDLTLVEGLRTVLTSKDWLDFYQKFEIRVFCYGKLDEFEKQGFAEIVDWIEELKVRTARNRKFQLFLGFLSPISFDDYLPRLVIDFYLKNGRQPEKTEQIANIYGKNIPPADFFIMSTKFAGLGALPPLLYNEKTQLYFLAAPGVLALTRNAFRRILYDYLFLRRTEARLEYHNDSQNNVAALAEYYNFHKESILGIGKRIGKFWVPTFDKEKGK